MIRWPLRQTADCRVRQYFVCPAARAADDPAHQPDVNMSPDSQILCTCSCGVTVTMDNARRMDVQ